MTELLIALGILVSILVIARIIEKRPKNDIPNYVIINKSSHKETH